MNQAQRQGGTAAPRVETSGPSPRCAWVPLCLCIFLLLLFSPAWALTPDQILLIANKNVPQSLQLADYYAIKRNLPQGHIVLLDLPSQEQIAPEQYQTAVVQPIRTFLQEHALRDKITCLVTFYGVPFRISQQVSSKEENQELAQLRLEEGEVRRKLQGIVTAAEQQAKTIRPASMPATAPTTAPATGESLAQRAEQALRTTLHEIGLLPPAQRSEPLKQFAQTLQQLGGTAAVVRQFAAAQIEDPRQTAAERNKWIGLRRQIESAQKELAQLTTRPTTAPIRKQIRQLIRDHFGLIAYVRLLNAQVNLLRNEETTAALDSELALLWWNDYPHSRWLPNPLHYGYTGHTPPVLMVMRLDAPRPGTVRDMILGSLKAEQVGLKGRIVLDSRGIAPFNKDHQPDGYGQYDQTIRNLAQLVRDKVKNLPLTWDDRQEPFPPHSVNSVALYCGWYSVHNYIPSFQFNTGAVGFHVASLEMVGLHADNERGWVHGLLNDGVVATLGPVAEPYLTAFPRADDFFPLLLTGKLPLAEVYWKTMPMTSWMICGIGDPLYTPFKNNPALKIEDLPPRLQGIFHPPATQPATQPR